LTVSCLLLQLNHKAAINLLPPLRFPLASRAANGIPPLQHPCSTVSSFLLLLRRVPRQAAATTRLC
jgi:hypothetical protein